MFSTYTRTDIITNGTINSRFAVNEDATFMATGDQGGAGTAGKILFFDRAPGGPWVKQTYELQSPNPIAGYYFGHAITMSGDGTVLIIGEYTVHDNDVYIFDLVNDVWSHRQTITTRSTSKGLSLTKDKDLLIIGRYAATPGNLGPIIYKLVNNQYVEDHYIAHQGTPGYFGNHVQMAQTKNRCTIHEQTIGIRTFEYFEIAEEKVWSNATTLLSNTEDDLSVSMTDDGQIMFLGDSVNNKVEVYKFERSPSYGWVLIETILPPANATPVSFGRNLHLSDNHILFIGDAGNNELHEYVLNYHYVEYELIDNIDTDEFDIVAHDMNSHEYVIRPTNTIKENILKLPVYTPNHLRLTIGPNINRNMFTPNIRYYKGDRFYSTNPNQEPYIFEAQSDGKLTAEPVWNTVQSSIEVYKHQHYLQGKKFNTTEIVGTSGINYFPTSVAVTSDGTKMTSGLYNSSFENDCKLLTFELLDGSWALTSTLEESDNNIFRFGWTSSMTADGSRLIVGYKTTSGTSETGGFRTYNWNPTTSSWDLSSIPDVLLSEIDDPICRISGDGTTVIAARAKYGTVTTNAGRCQIYKLVGNAWTFQYTIENPNPVTNDYFGFSISINNDGTTVGIGSNGTGNTKCYIFSLSTSASLIQTIGSDSPVSGENFGKMHSMSLDGQKLLIGSFGTEGKLEYYEYETNLFVFKHQVDLDITGLTGSEVYNKESYIRNDGYFYLTRTNIPNPEISSTTYGLLEEYDFFRVKHIDNIEQPKTISPVVPILGN